MVLTNNVLHYNIYTSKTKTVKCLMYVLGVFHTRRITQTVTILMSTD